MKFRDLKKKEWTLYFDSFYTDLDEYYEVKITYHNKVLYATATWEYDNGLYTETGTFPFDISWKLIKYNIQHHELRWQKQNRKPYYFMFYDGKCKKCHKQISFEEWDNMDSWCENCEDKYWEEEARKADELDKDEYYASLL